MVSEPSFAQCLARSSHNGVENNEPKRWAPPGDNATEWVCDICGDLNVAAANNCNLCWRAKESALTTIYFNDSYYNDSRLYISEKRSRTGEKVGKDSKRARKGGSAAKKRRSGGADSPSADGKASSRRGGGSSGRGPREYKCNEPDCGMVMTNPREFKTHVAQHKWGPHKIVKDATTGALSFHCLHPECGKIISGTSMRALRRLR